jgi:hypothetical protein
MLSREDFIIRKEGKHYKVVQVMYSFNPFSPSCMPTRHEMLIESGLTRLRAERRIYEYIIEQMKQEYEKRVASLQMEIQDLVRR